MRASSRVNEDFVQSLANTIGMDDRFVSTLACVRTCTARLAAPLTLSLHRTPKRHPSFCHPHGLSSVFGNTAVTN